MASSLLTHVVEADAMSDCVLAGDFRALIAQVGAALQEAGITRVAPATEAGAVIVGGLVHAGAAVLCRWHPERSEDVALIDGVAVSPLALGLARSQWGTRAKLGIVIKAPTYMTTATPLPVIAIDVRNELRAAG